jgi:phosphoribosyl 1,2-cyclic phosphodiesterase
MLANGPYPWHLKQRIRSRHGHLSNRESAGLLEEIIHPDLEVLFLAHLSEVNNLPEAAREVFSASLAAQSECLPTLLIGSQHCVSEVCEI